MSIKPSPLVHLVMHYQYHFKQHFINLFKNFFPYRSIKNVIKPLIFLIPFTLFPQNIDQQVVSETSYDIKGYVKDKKSGEALVYTNVVIENSIYEF